MPTEQLNVFKNGIRTSSTSFHWPPWTNVAVSGSSPTLDPRGSTSAKNTSSALSFIQNASFLIQNPSFLIQNPSFLLQNSAFLMQNSSLLMQKSSFCNAKAIILKQNTFVVLLARPLLDHAPAWRVWSRMMHFRIKRDGLQFKRGECCVKNDEFRIKNDEFCIQKWWILVQAWRLQEELCKYWAEQCESRVELRNRGARWAKPE